MANFQLAESWLLITVTTFMCDVAEAYQIIYVDKTFLECLKEVKTGSNVNLRTINRLKLISMIKLCPTRSENLEDLLVNENQSEIKVVFTDDKITLLFKNENVVLFQNRVENPNKLLITGSRYLGSFGSVVASIKSMFQPKKTLMQPMQPYIQPTRSNHMLTYRRPPKRSDNMQSYMQPSIPEMQAYPQPMRPHMGGYDQPMVPGGEIYPQPMLPMQQPPAGQPIEPWMPPGQPMGPPMQPQPMGPPMQPQPMGPPMQPPMGYLASISKTMIENISKTIDTLWLRGTNMLRIFIRYFTHSDCFMLPKIAFNTALLSMRLEQFQICGLANINLGTMTKIMGPGYWNVSATSSMQDMTMTFGGLHVHSQILPALLSNIDLDGIRFHFDGLYIQTSLIIPFKLLFIPSNFRITVEGIENFKVNFLTPKPTLKQRLMAFSMEKSGGFIIEQIFDTISSLSNLPKLLTKLLPIG